MPPPLGGLPRVYETFQVCQTSAPQRCLPVSTSWCHIYAPNSLQVHCDTWRCVVAQAGARAAGDTATYMHRDAQSFAQVETQHNTSRDPVGLCWTRAQ